MPPTPPNSPYAPGNMPVTPRSTSIVPFDYGMWTPWQYSPMPADNPLLAGPAMPPPAAPPPVAAPLPTGDLDPVSGQPMPGPMPGAAPAGQRLYAEDPFRADIYTNLAHTGRDYGLDPLRAAGNWGRKAFGAEQDRTLYGAAPGPDSGPRPLPTPPWQTGVWDDPYAQQQAQQHMQQSQYGYQPSPQQQQRGPMRPQGGGMAARGPQVSHGLQGMIRRIRGW